MTVASPVTAGNRYAPGGPATRRFPLLPRAKPPCRPLGWRLDRVTRLASQAQAGDGDALVHAAGACNLAALIASDCAMPGLARNLCWHQFGTYPTAGPYGETTAKLALQPLINLARLRIRDGNHAGYQIIQSLYNAARSAERPAVIDGRTIDIAALIAPGARETITEWLWAILLTDGLRALCQAGRWTDATRQARQHDGIGKRLLGGRQTAILALAADSHGEEARRLLRETDATEPWEHAVAACLRALIHDPDGQAPSRAAAEMTRACLTLDDPGHPMFIACLDLTAAELTEPGDGQSAAVGEAIRIATRSGDGYIAREIITSPIMPIVPEEALAHLRDIVRQSGLGRPLTEEQSQRLEDSVRSASTTLAAGIGAS